MSGFTVGACCAVWREIKRVRKGLTVELRVAVYCVLSAMAFSSAVAEEQTLSFSRDVQPILAQKCYACHGPDDAHRAADLRLDDRDAAIEMYAIVPGEPEDSELIRRIESDDDSERMPPPNAHETLTEQEVQILRQWISSGAEYAPHWAFSAPALPAIPEVKDQSWPKNPIDHFILSRLEKEGLAPSPPIDRYGLVRRVYLDLTGLPPTVDEADEFINDSDPLAYEKLVDRLLASPAYGERFGRLWLDLARYADSNGYEKDRYRSIWPYRDWVINSINADLPFDQFSIEQLAGDMLPNATVDQRIATGFHRNTMLNEEGGIDPLEFRYYAMVDRVATTGTVWMGLTTGCAQCHTHKYDPITHTDYFALMALLNNADEPSLIVRDPEITEKRNQILAQIAEQESLLPAQFPAAEGAEATAENRQKHLEQEFANWLEERQQQAAKWTTLRPSQMKTNLPRLELLEDGSIFSTGDITKRDVYELTIPINSASEPLTALRLEVLPDDRLPEQGPGRAYYEGRLGDFFLSEVTAEVNGTAVPFRSASHSYGRIMLGAGNANATNVIDQDGSTGWSTAGREGEPHQLVLNFAEPLAVDGELHLTLLFERHFAASLGRFRWSATTKNGDVIAQQIPVELEALLAKGEDCNADERQQLQKHFMLTTPQLEQARKQIETLRAQLPNYPTTLIFEERQVDNPRNTRLHHRGEYLAEKELVEPAVPVVFEPLPEDEPANRLTFAKWLFSERNPLSARVTADRAWRTFFGNGIVRTNGDYGIQSEPPTHPELLDWLACEVVRLDWSIKKLHRLIVTSSAYQQGSELTPDLSQRDPENFLIARMPRQRVDAEIVRDIMLSTSGILSDKMLGPSVYPPQPASVTALGYGHISWPISQGEERFRRSLYTFSQRTTPFAAYAVFDGPTGEVCITNRDRSNTPLQALTLLNDEMFLEIAQAMGQRIEQQPDLTTDEQMTLLFRKLLTRPPTDRELQGLLAFYHKQKQRLEAGELQASVIAGNEAASADLASWVMVTRALMNLDETVTRP